MILREIIDRSSIAERLSERTRIVEEENDIQIKDMKYEIRIERE